MSDLEAQAPPLQPPLHNTASARDREPDPADIEKYRKWWEERKVRKLRGQYESALVQLSELVSDTPCDATRKRVNTRNR